jgi:hypothetical protein
MTPTQAAAPAWTEDYTDRPIWTASDWSDWIGADWITDRKALVQRFGDDLADFALLRLLIAQQRGQNIHDSLAWCWTVAKRRQWREEHQARRYVSMNLWNSAETEKVPEGLRDLVTPERRVIARDLLARAHPSLVAQLCGEKTTVSPRMRTYWRAKLRALADE